jgi:hypothetical protein
MSTVPIVEAPTSAWTKFLTGHFNGHNHSELGFIKPGSNGVHVVVLKGLKGGSAQSQKYSEIAR